MNSPIRMLIRSLRQKGVRNDLGLEVPVDFTKTYNFLMENLNGIGSSYKDLYAKLEGLANKYESTKPELTELIKRLREPSFELDTEIFDFQTKFLQDFNKYKYPSTLSIYDEKGNIITVDAVKQTYLEQTKQKFIDGIDNNSTQDEKGNKTLKSEKRAILNITDKVLFLKGLGFDISEETELFIKGNKLNDLDIAVSVIKDYIKSNDYNITNLFSDEKVKGRINYIIELEANNSTDKAGFSFMNANGETQYSVGENNALTITISNINNSTSLEELFKTLPQLNNEYTKGSYWLTKLFKEDGTRNKEYSLSIGLVNGAKSDAEDIKKGTRNQTLGDLYIQQINDISKEGRSSHIVSSDATQEFSIGLVRNNKKELSITSEELSDGFKSKKLLEIDRKSTRLNSSH